jgi:hypothetical protein
MWQLEWYRDQARVARALLRSKVQPGRILSILPAVEATGASRYWNENPSFAKQLREQAERVVEGRVDIYGASAVDCQNWSWRTHFQTGAALPWGIAPVDMDSFHGGDLWLQSWVSTLAFCPALAQAYRNDNDPRFLEAIVQWVESWDGENSPLESPFWRDGLTTGLRCSSLLYTAALCGDALNFADQQRIARTVKISGHLLEQHCKRVSLNHLIGEAYGLFLCGVAFREEALGRRWMGKAAAILETELSRQFFGDGVHAERTADYFGFTLEIYLHYRSIGERFGVKFSADFDERIQHSCTALLVLLDANGGLPHFGDNSGLSLAVDSTNCLALASVLYQREDFKSAVSHFPVTAWWLLGDAGYERFCALPRTPRKIESAALPEAGVYLMKSEKATLTVTCGSEKFPKNGHAHADVFSFELESGGERLIADPGTYLYRGGHQWRRFFRSTAAHNTGVVDGQDQATPIATDEFGWLRYPTVTPHQWSTSSTLDFLDAQHDGYERFGVIHRRQMLFLKPDYWLLVDHFLGTGIHECAVHFQLAPGALAEKESGCFELSRPGGTLQILAVGGDYESDVIAGSENPPRGWISSEYGAKEAAPSLRLIQRAELPVRFVTLLVPSADASARFSPLDGRLEVSAGECRDRIWLPSSSDAERIVVERDGRTESIILKQRWPESAAEDVSLSGMKVVAG